MMMNYFRSSLRLLMPKAKCKAVKQPLFLTYEQELTNMISGVNDFVLAAGDACAEPDMDDELLKDMEKNMIALTRQCEHHNLGAKAAKLRFMVMLG